MSNAWYPRYTGDFIRDTSHLSLVEVGAYNRILDHYYASSGPLCMTEAQVMRLCAAVTPEECEAVKYVLSAYFILEPEDGCYHNPRADKELLSMAEHHARLSEAGRKGGLNSVQARLEAGLKRGNKRGASISTITTTTTSRNIIKDIDPQFASFWQAYPKRKGKPYALKAFVKAMNKTTLDVILSAINMQSASDDWKKEGGKYIPFPATWLNGERWTDELETNAQPSTGQYGSLKKNCGLEP
jgi:uncharacterized protein YdaU (DUF1376 family)